ncbi:MAG: hypothetical protein ACI9U2_003717 [Bradymonadia bacterium]
MGRWARVTTGLRDALTQFSAQGGSVVTEYDGLTLLAEARREGMRWRAGAPQPWGWLPISVGAGNARAVGTPITATAPDDPALRGLTPSFSAQSGTESFSTVSPVDQGVDTLLTQIATFPGLPGNPQFPNDTHPGALRGARCGGNVLIAPFDYQDGAAIPAGQRFIENLAATAASPAPNGRVDVCPPPLQRVMICGRADVDPRVFLPADREMPVVEGCAPDALVQALMITRNAEGIDGAACAAGS